MALRRMVAFFHEEKQGREVILKRYRQRFRGPLMSRGRGARGSAVSCREEFQAPLEEKHGPELTGRAHSVGERGVSEPPLQLPPAGQPDRGPLLWAWVTSLPISGHSKKLHAGTLTRTKWVLRSLRKAPTKNKAPK